MTETDIPPGGDGKIEVTFDSGIKRGRQTKTITVESNDPVNPKIILEISALIEVEFGFETNSLNMGGIHKGETSSKTAHLLIKDPSKRKFLELSSQAPNLVAVRTVESPAGEEDRIPIEFTVSPETPLGRFNVTVTAKLSDDSYPPAFLRINWSVVGNVEVTPELVRFTVDKSKEVTEEAEQKVRVASTKKDAKLQLLSVNDPDHRLAFEIDTLVADAQYEIKAKPYGNALKLERNASGYIKILTDDPEQPVIQVRYIIIVFH